MGCCLSSSNRQSPNHQNASSHRHSPPSKPPPAPPQPVVEEESVKEVLSETSVPIQQQIRVPIPQNKCTETPSHKEREIETNNTDLVDKQEEEEEEEEGHSQVQGSQLSEMCSSINSETLSTATTVTENREDEAVSRRVNRSPLRKRPHTSELGGARERPSKSPARRGNPPTRSDRIGSRPGRGSRELSGQLRNTRRSVRSRSSEVMIDSGEGAGRRSRSPATPKAGKVGRGGGGGDSPVRVTGRGGGMRLVGAAREVEEASKVEENGGSSQKQGNESLDNPVVSLECFIFL